MTDGSRQFDAPADGASRRTASHSNGQSMQLRSRQAIELRYARGTSFVVTLRALRETGIASPRRDSSSIHVAQRVNASRRSESI